MIAEAAFLPLLSTMMRIRAFITALAVRLQEIEKGYPKW